MAGNSYLTPADSAAINQIRRDILATKVALQEPAVSLVISRQNSAGVYVDLPAQTVYLKIESSGATQASQRQTPAAGSSFVSGNIQKESPFDVQAGDAFRLANGWAGHVTAVRPIRANIIRADITISTGYAP